MINKRNIIIISAILLIIGLVLTLSYNVENIIGRSGGLVLEGSDFTNGTDTLEARIMSSDEPEISSYTTIIDRSEIENIGTNSVCLVVFRLNAMAYSVHFNGEHIDTYGDMAKARSHVYNSVGLFNISKDKIKDTNTLEIKTHSLYMVGLETAPAGIVGCETARKMVESLDFRTEYLTLIGIGIFLLGITVTVMMIFLSQKKNYSLIYFMISILFLSIYSLDFMNFTQLFIPYIIFKKIIIFSLFACIFFLGISFSKMFNSKISYIFSSVLFSLVTIAIILVGDMLLFKKIYDILIPLISLNFILWIVIAARNLKEKDEAIIFLCSFVNLLIIALSDGLQLVILGGTVSTSIATHVLVFSMILISLLYLEINRRNLAIEHETRQRSHFYQQAITDPMTGAFNLKHTMNLLSHEKPPYTLVMLDVDDFKNINDRYGHPAGDYILKYLVRKMLDEFRDSDIIGRYGGDEFIVVLRGCSEKNAFDIMNRFRMHIDHDKIRFGGDTISITLSIGIAHCDNNEAMENVVKFADEALYRAKHSGKNQVSI
jgi:diguanylate cyclase (GGDEF)-like protein